MTANGQASAPSVSAIAPGRRISRHGRSGPLQRLARLFGFIGKPASAAPLIDLHERGIVVHHAAGQRREFFPFAGLGDVYRYKPDASAGGLVSGMAFRRDIHSPWVVVPSGRDDAFRLRGSIIEGQLRERGPLALRALETGQGVSFHAIPDEAKAAHGGLGCLADKAIQLLLTPSGLTAGGLFVPMDDVASIDEGTHSGALRLLDGEGRVLWGVHYLSLFSADLFIVLIRTLIEAREFGLGGVGSNKGY